MALLVLANTTACTQNRVVERPRFTARTVDAFEINRIELNKENTVVYLDVTTDKKNCPDSATQFTSRLATKHSPLLRLEA